MEYRDTVDKIVWPNPHAAKLFVDEVALLKKHNLNEKHIAERFEVSTIRFRALYAKANNCWWMYLKEKAKKMNKEGYSCPKIAMELGLSESTIRKFFESKEDSGESEDGG